MVKLALLIPVLLAGVAPPAFKVDGVEPVKVNKTIASYPVKCGTPLKFSAEGPTNLVIDVRAKADALEKAVELDFARNDKSVSKNPVTLKKSKTAGKGFAGLGKIVIAVPEGTQQYSLTCDAPSEIGLSFKASKKPVKGAPEAAAETELEKPKAAPEPEAKKEEEKAKEAAAAAGAASSAGYYGLYHSTGF